MSRNEVIDLTQKMSGANFVKSKNHWHYLWREKLLPELNNRVVLRLVQATTTNRSGLITEKLLRWNGTIELTLNELDHCNYWHPDWEDMKLSNRIDSFWGNMDETSMSAADVTLTQIFNISFSVYLTCSSNHYTISNLLYYQALQRYLHLNM